MQREPLPLGCRGGRQEPQRRGPRRARALRPAGNAGERQHLKDQPQRLRPVRRSARGAAALLPCCHVQVSRRGLRRTEAVRAPQRQRGSGSVSGNPSNELILKDTSSTGTAQVRRRPVQLPHGRVECFPTDSCAFVRQLLRVLLLLLPFLLAQVPGAQRRQVEDWRAHF